MGLVKSTSLYTIGNIIPQAAGFLLLPIYTEYLSPSDYGIISSMQVLSSILVIIFTLAINRSIYRLYFDYKTEQAKKDYLGTITISLLIISLIVLLLLFVFNGVIGNIFESIDFFPYYSFTILTAFFLVFSLIPKIYLQITDQPGHFVLISIIQFVLNTGFVLYFVVLQENGAEGMLKGKMLGAMLILPYFLFISYRIINFRFKLNILKESLAFSLPMIPAILSAWILNMSDRVFIERYFSLNEVGIYSLGYQIAGLVLVFTGAFNTAYNPVFYKLASSENQPEAKNNLYNYNSIYITVLIVMVFLISFFSREAIEIFLNPKYIDAYKIVPIIAIAYLISQISGLFNLMIYQEKKVTQLMIITLVGSLLNILLNYLLIPIFAAYGAAYATVLSFCFIFLASWWYARKCYYIPINFLRIGLILLSFILLDLFFLFDFGLNIYFILIIKIVISLLILLVFIKKYYNQIVNLITKKV